MVEWAAVSAAGACRKGDCAMFNLVKRFWQEEEGATATEYAVMLALIIVIALGAISALGDQVSSTFSDVQSELESAGG